MKRLGLYFSGTGNTELCVHQFMKELDGTHEMCSIEQANASELIKEVDEIIFGYPVYYSNLPMIVKDFIHQNKKLWENKKIFVISTMGLFSGDGSGCAARIFEKYGAQIIGGQHVLMPDNTIDVGLLKKTPQKEQELIDSSLIKIKRSAVSYHKNPQQQGLNFGSRALGLFGQRLWFKNKTSSYKSLPKINHETCIGCNACVKLCPMNNLSINTNKEIINSDRCTLCYRCVHICPTQSITILGSKVVHHPSQRLKK